MTTKRARSRCATIPLGGDLRHVLVGLMHPLFAAIALGEGDCLGKVARIRGRKLVSSGIARG